MFPNCENNVASLHSPWGLQFLSYLMTFKNSREASMLPKANFRDPPSTELMSFIERQEDYINQLEKESQYCRVY